MECDVNDLIKELDIKDFNTKMKIKSLVKDL